MKRFVLLTILLLCSCSLYAQYGLRVGPALSTFNGDIEDPGYLFGYKFGSYLEVVDIQKKLVIGPEVYLSLLGAKDNMKNELSLLYIQTPIMARYYFQSRSKGFFAETGAGLNFLLSAEYEAASMGDDVEDDFRNFEYYLPLGIGYYDGAWGVTATYHLGIRDISDVEGTELRNSSFSILVTLPLFNNTFGGYGN